MQGWRTVIFNAAAGALMAIQSTDFTTLLPSKYLWAAGLITAVVNIGLRTVTTTPIGVKPDAPK